jgi:hypothetical protein
MSEIYRLKTWIEANSYMIEVIKSKIYDFCWESNTNINALDIIKTDSFTSKLYIDIEGKEEILMGVRKYLEDVNNQENRC